MRVFKQKYKDRKGKTRESAKWYVEFKDHLDTIRRIPGFTDKKPTQELGRRLEKLVSVRVMGDTPGPEMAKWLESIPADLRKRITKIGLLDSRTVASGKPLKGHADDFIATLRNAGRNKEYCQSLESKVRLILDGCQFRHISDISASRLQTFLAKLKADGLGQRTVNHYLAAIKQFTRWLVSDHRTGENRLAHLKGGNAKLDVRRERRELTDAEIKLLLEAAHTGSPVNGLTGWQRLTL